MTNNFRLQIDAGDWTAKISTTIHTAAVKSLRFFGKISNYSEFKDFYIADDMADDSPELFVGDFALLIHRHYGPVDFCSPTAGAMERPNALSGFLFCLPGPGSSEDTISVNLYPGEDTFDELWLRHRMHSNMPDAVVLEIEKTASMYASGLCVWNPGEELLLVKNIIFYFGLLQQRELDE